MLQKTNTFKSPLLKPVMERDYTRGIAINEKGATVAGAEVPPTPPPAGKSGGEAPPPPPPPGASPKYNIPPDETKEFAFDDIPESPGDIGEGERGAGIGITTASAKTFANFVGNNIQIYLPKLTYSYSKVDIESVIVNIQKGILTSNWLDTFENINARTWEALKIPDEVIRMWKAAFKDYLEYKNIQLANPETAFWGATAVLIADQGIRAHQCKKANEMYMKQALQHCSPDLFIKKGGGQAAEGADKNLGKDKEDGSKAA